MEIQLEEPHFLTLLFSLLSSISLKPKSHAPLFRPFLLHSLFSQWILPALAGFCSRLLPGCEMAPNSGRVGHISYDSIVSWTDFATIWRQSASVWDVGLLSMQHRYVNDIFPRGVLLWQTRLERVESLAHQPQQFLNFLLGKLPALISTQETRRTCTYLRIAL